MRSFARRVYVFVHACVCACVRERERERQGHITVESAVFIAACVQTHTSIITVFVMRLCSPLGLELMVKLRIKCAVCRILTLLKHKNTIICLQIFKKHAKLTYLFIWKTMLQSVILLWKCAFRPGMSVFVMICETRPLPVYPIVFRHPGLPVGGKHSVFNFIHHHVRSFLLVSLNWQPACTSSLRRRGWWKKKCL